jgi:hypothetical protein
MLLDAPASFSSQGVVPPVPVVPVAAGTVADPSEDHMLLLLDALEFAVQKGNLEDARRRIQTIRRLRFEEKGYK